MPMRTMSITIDEDLYGLLKQTAGSRGMSRFISDAVRQKLRARQQDLYEEYRQAAQDRERQKELEDWDVVDGEGWQ